MPVSDICSQGIVTVQKNASLQFVASQMKRQHVGSVIVVESDAQPQKPVGILTDRDIVLKAIAENLSLTEIKAGDVMTKNLVTVDKDTGVSEVIQLMQKRGVRRVVVLDQNKRLCGLLSADDLVQLLGEEMGSIGGLFKMQARNEEKQVTSPGRLS